MPDHVDRGLAQDLLAATAAEGVAGPGVDERDRQRLVVDGGDLAVLAEQDPGVAALELHGLEQVGPQPAHVEAVKLKRRFTWIGPSQNAQVVAVDEKTLTIALVNAGARNSFSSGGSEEILRQAAIDVIGARLAGRVDRGPVGPARHRAAATR